MNIKELRLKTEQELRDLIKNSLDEIRVARWNSVGGRERNTRLIRKTKRTVARVKTLLGGKSSAPKPVKL